MNITAHALTEMGLIIIILNAHIVCEDWLFLVTAHHWPRLPSS